MTSAEALLPPIAGEPEIAQSEIPDPKLVYVGQLIENQYKTLMQVQWKTQFWEATWFQVLGKINEIFEKLSSKWLKEDYDKLFFSTLFLLMGLKIKEIEGFESDLRPYGRSRGKPCFRFKSLEKYLLPLKSLWNLELELTCLLYKIKD